MWRKSWVLGFRPLVAMASLLALLSLTAVLCVLFVAPGAKAEDGAPLRIGLLIPLSGDLADFGPPHQNAAELAAMHVNNAGGVLGEDIELVVGDTGTSPGTGVEEALRLIEEEGVSAIVGALSSGVTLAVAENATVPNGILQISAGSTSPALTTFEDSDLLFRTALSDAAQGEVLASLAGELGYETASTLYVNGAWGQSLSDVFAAEFEALDGEILATVPHEQSQDTYVDELVEATAGDPDVLAAISWSQSAIVYLDEAIANGLINEFLFVDGTKSQEMFDALGAEQFNGMYGTAPGGVDSPAGDSFDAAYEAQYIEPPPVAFMREAYDAVVLIALAAEAAGSTDPEDIRDALRGIANPPGEIVGLGADGIGHALDQVRLGNDVDYEGASGTVVFDVNGDICGGAIEIWYVKDGQIQTVRMEPVQFCTLGALIDIKPGTDPNSTNLGSTGVIPVAILTTPDFDAASVDPASVVFARPDGAAPVRDALEDVDGDGDLDLIMHFRTQETNIADDAEEACLMGETFDGLPIEGCDSVRIVPPEGRPGSHDQTLGDVQDRGSLVCGVHDAAPGFGFRELDGSYSGFDTDFCRAIAAAVLGDATKVQFVPLTAAARFPALQTGQIDVLIRNTTWTITRDAAAGLSFAVTTFYDGQGMMVRAADGFATVDDLANSTICVLQGTTTELNLAVRLPGSTPLGFEDNETLQAAFIAGACDGWTSDKSQLAVRRFIFPDDEGGPESLVILDETFSKEPLGPLTRDNDDQWFDVVNWVTIGMIIADEKGITSDNLQGFVDDPGGAETARLLGVSFQGGEIFDPGLGIDPDFMQDVISQVGNYGEVYENNITPIGIAREGTLNASFTDGGLIYAPPWR